MDVKRRFGLLAATAVAVPLAFAGCTTDQRADDRTTERAAARPEPPSITVTPAENTRDVPISAELGVAVQSGRVSSVRITDDRGTAVPATARADGSTWVPDRPLKNQQRYRAEVTATNDAGQQVTRATTFTTMAKPSKPTTTSTLYFSGNRTYGTAMPVTVAFDPGIPKEARADVQRRLFVRTDPPQPGTWSWLEDGSQAYYRAPDFWRPGTTIDVRAGLEGLPIGSKAIGDSDRRATSKVGRQVALEIDNATKQISVFQDAKLVRKIPVSLGKPSTPSSSGKMVIMEKHEQTVFDTRGEPNGGYVVTVQDAQRLTWGGEFIHAAPWSEGDQGNRNVSHGCANVSSSAASWLMGVTQVGDLVTVKGTEVELTEGNGWTAWNQSWPEFARGSALPVPANLQPSPSATAPTPGPPVASGAPEPVPSGSGG